MPIDEGGLSPGDRFPCKDDLGPGVKVRNAESGRIGTLRADPENESELMKASVSTVAVETRIRSGKNAGRKDYAWWSLSNVVYLGR